MSTQSQTKLIDEEWVKILNKGLMTIPKSMREKVGIKEGEVAKVRRIGRILVIEPRDIADYRIFTDKEIEEWVKNDKLPANLVKKVKDYWPDLP